MRVPHSVLRAIEAHARRASPQECCGLLIGRDDRIIDAVETSNTAADPIRRYEIPPVEHVRQIHRCRALTAQHGSPIAVIGAYHSHPHSAPEPSPTDLEQAFGDFLFVIAGPVHDVAGLEIHAYRLSDGRFERVDLIVDDTRQAIEGGPEGAPLRPTAST
jgi:proteasome lid subunit RPN8/RPN11